MRCEELMTAEVGTVQLGDDVQAAARVMRDLNVGFVPVCQQNGEVVGVLTDRDIAVRVVADGCSPQTPVDEVMSEEIVTCHPSVDLKEVERLMGAHQVNRVLVVDDDGRLAGVISLTDLAQVEDARKVGQMFGDISGREAVAH
jgi:CBS domain-containing protein